MKIGEVQNKWTFLFVCMGLGILADISFLRGRIGLSYLIFITIFYIVVFLRYKLSFNHRRIGLLFTIAIWLLSGSYLLHDHTVFYSLNLFVIPILVFSHIVLITSPNTFIWNTPKFLSLLKIKIIDAKNYSIQFCKETFSKVFYPINSQTTQIIKKMVIGIVISMPLLLIIILLLMSADIRFQEVVLILPDFLFRLNLLDWTFRFIFILFTGLLFFGTFQVLPVDKLSELNHHQQKKVTWDSITVITILILINLVYLLFVFVQFKYFFSGRLINGYTYAEYARSGFFELIIVLIINWSLLISFFKLVNEKRKHRKITLNILYSLIIVMSAIMLTSAYMRLNMYESAYGYTVDRMLAHAFMIFLIVIFAYTFVHVWIEKLSLLHFYLIVGLIFYTTLNIINVEKVVVDKNIDRYQEIGKIDMHYLNSLSYTGLDGLITLYELGEDDPELISILSNRKESIEKQTNTSWQSFNFTKQQAVQHLKELDLDK